jgi:hypothetical protein
MKNFSSLSPLPRSAVNGVVHGFISESSDHVQMRQLIRQHLPNAQQVQTFHLEAEKHGLVLEVPWNQALETWRTLRSLTELSGYYPLLLESLDELKGHLSRKTQAGATLERVVQEADQLEPPEILKNRRQRLEKLHGYDENFPPSGEYPEDLYDPFEEYYYTLHYRYEPAPQNMTVLLVPTQNPWEAPAWLHFGGFGHAPKVAEQTAMLQSWYLRYGAEPILLSRDVLEMRVMRPPQTPEQALDLALEQFYFCDDIVYQGTGSLEALACTLHQVPTWYFWWKA